MPGRSAVSWAYTHQSLTLHARGCSAQSRRILPLVNSPELQILSALATKCGAVIRGAIPGSAGIVVRWSHPDDRLRFLAVLSEHDASYDPRLRGVAASIVGPAIRAGLDEWGQLAVLLYAVQARVTYLDEKVETFVRPYWTWEKAFGDCDDSATLIASLVLSIGHEARLLTVGGSGGPAHVVAQVRPRGSENWAWAETTVRAQLGEHPLKAKARMG